MYTVQGRTVIKIRVCVGGGGGGGSTFLFYKHIYDYFLQQINKLNKKNLRISPAICAIFSLKFIGESFLLILFLFCFFIIFTWYDDWNGAVANKLHSVKPVLGD